MTEGSSLKSDLIAAIPSLRAFAVSLSGNPDRADDLVQETLMKAWSNLASFTEGTNLAAWLFTILRNIYYSEYRKRRREVPDPEGIMASRLGTAPDQLGHMDFLDFRAALAKLPPDQREALILVGASGMSYEDAAAVCECAVGTMKSRVNRARNRLVQLLSIASTQDIGDDQWRAGLQSLAFGQHLSRTGSD
jgi:RNA polymerase sigma-70 factor, ECF subfamily